MIKEVKTEKFEGLAVLVPDDAHTFFIHPLMCILGWTDGNGSNFSNLEYLKCEILGKATELTEEQCAEIINSDEWPMTVKGFLYWPDFNNIDDQVTETAKEAFETLTESMECYYENPIAPPIERLQYGGGYAMRQSEVDEYEKAQKQTGTWLILKKL